MGPEPRFDFREIVRDLQARGIRFVLFGGQAVRLYGSQRVTKDYDLWIESTARQATLAYLEEERGFELSSGGDEPRPVVIAHAGPEKLDAWFVKVMRNREGTDIVFEDVYRRSRIVRDDAEGLAIHVPDFLRVRKAAEEAGDI